MVLQTANFSSFIVNIFDVWFEIDRQLMKSRYTTLSLSFYLSFNEPEPLHECSQEFPFISQSFLWKIRYFLFLPHTFFKVITQSSSISFFFFAAAPPCSGIFMRIVYITLFTDRRGQKKFFFSLRPQFFLENFYGKL